MTTINFNYNSKDVIIQCDENDNIKKIFEKFCNKTGSNLDSLYFLYDGNSNIDTNLSIIQVANKEDKIRKYMNILVKDIDDIDKDPSIVESNEVICPKCGGNACIYFEDFKINIECRAGHKINNMLFNEFQKTQYIDISKIICEDCKIANKSTSYNNKFYTCFLCKKNLCPLCKTKHDKSHYIIDYELRNYKCPLHQKDYISFCKTCKIDLCQFCENDHKQHNLMSFGKLVIIPEKLKTQNHEIQTKIDEFSKNIEEIIDRFKKIKEGMKYYIKILTFIVNSYDMKKINYETIENIKKLTESQTSYNYIVQELEELKQYEISTKAHKILDLYNKMCIKNTDYITLVYKVGKDDKTVNLFCEEFVKNNKDICKVIIEGVERNLGVEYPLDNLNKRYNKLEIKLKGINKIKNASWMFFKCSSLLSLPDINKWDTINVVDMACMFSHFRSLGLPEEMSRWNTSNVTNMSNMFYNCEILCLPDISNWDTSKVKDMSYMFSECSSLIQMPDISKWNTSNIVDMEGIFNKCYSLESLPDISKWNTQNVKKMANLFKSCGSLNSLPDISNWVTSNVTDMSYMFYECTNLVALPDISNWNTSNVQNMKYMFYDCESLKELPNINKWNIDNLHKKSKMFEKCNDSLEIPSKFKTTILDIFSKIKINI